MSNNKKMKREKKIKRCALTGKIINPNEQVIPVSKFKEYAVKMGYKLIPLSAIDSLKVFVCIFLVLGALLMSPFANAQPPFQTSETGLNLQVSYSDYHYLNEDLYINVHSYDRDTGFIINSSLLNGYYHLYNHNLGGIHIINDGVLNDIFGVELANTINGSYFNETGEYSVLMWVTRNDNTEGGFFSYNFNVIEREKESLNTIFNLEIDYLGILIIVFLILLVSFVLIKYELILLSSVFVVIAGAILLFNEIIIVGLIIITLGIIIAFMGRDK